MVMYMYSTVTDMYTSAKCEWTWILSYASHSVVSVRPTTSGWDCVVPVADASEFCPYAFVRSTTTSAAIQSSPNCRTAVGVVCSSRGPLVVCRRTWVGTRWSRRAMKAKSVAGCRSSATSIWEMDPATELSVTSARDELQVFTIYTHVHELKI